MPPPNPVRPLDDDANIRPPDRSNIPSSPALTRWRPGLVRSDFYGCSAISLYLKKTQRGGVERLYISMARDILWPVHDIGMVVLAYY
jgi:hypothetical protein